MRIAIFSPNKNPYSETFIQAHKNLLKGEVYYYYGDDGILLENHGTLSSKPYRLFLNLIKIVFNKSSSFVRDALLKHSFKKNKIDVVLVEYGTHAQLLLSFLKFSGLPVVVHFHGYDASVYKTIKVCGNYKELFNIASKVIAVSKVMEAKLLAIGCPEYKLKYNVYGPNPDFLNVTPNFTKSQFVSVGRFMDKKAPYYTILAFNEVIRSYPEARLLMAGSGPLVNTCKNLVDFYELEKNVLFLGVITPEKFRELLSESLAFVQHSITASNGDMEGTPVAVLEASAAGLPVISTFHAGIPDVIVHGETGLLCEEHDVNGMSTHMLTLLKNKELALELGAKGKERIKLQFNMEKHIANLQEVLETSLKK